MDKIKLDCSPRRYGPVITKVRVFKCQLSGDVVALHWFLSHFAFVLFAYGHNFPVAVFLPPDCFLSVDFNERLPGLWLGGVVQRCRPHSSCFTIFALWGIISADQVPGFPCVQSFQFWQVLRLVDQGQALLFFSLCVCRSQNSEVPDFVKTQRKYMKQEPFDKGN